MIHVLFLHEHEHILIIANSPISHKKKKHRASYSFELYFLIVNGGCIHLHSPQLTEICPGETREKPTPRGEYLNVMCRTTTCRNVMVDTDGHSVAAKRTKGVTRFAYGFPWKTGGCIPSGRERSQESPPKGGYILKMMIFLSPQLGHVIC